MANPTANATVIQSFLSRAWGLGSTGDASVIPMGADSWISPAGEAVAPATALKDGTEGIASVEGGSSSAVRRRKVRRSRFRGGGTASASSSLGTRRSTLSFATLADQRTAACIRRLAAGAVRFDGMEHQSGAQDSDVDLCNRGCADCVCRARAFAVGSYRAGQPC